MRDVGNVVRGYLFSHCQDSEAAVRGQGIYLDYGSAGDEEDEASALAIAREVVGVLSSHGLTAEWDGRWTSRIFMQLDWKKRRTG